MQFGQRTVCCPHRWWSADRNHGVIDGKVVLHVKQGKKQDCILLERLIEKIHHAAASDTMCSDL